MTFKLGSENFRPVSKSQWVKCMTANGTLRAVAIQATDVVRTLATWHPQLQPDSHLRLGEATIAALCVASYCKDGEHVNLNIRGTGMVRQAIVDATHEGVVRGYVVEGASALESSDGSPRGPWGEGLLAVLRSKSNVGGTPYIGTVPILTGHLAKDMTFYWHQSEQLATAVGLKVWRPDANRDSVAAYGFMVQAVPGCAEEDLQWIENSLKTMPDFVEQMDAEVDPMQVVAQLFSERAFSVLEKRDLFAKCQCNQDRADRAIRVMGKKEIEILIKLDPVASVTCDFCRTEYRVVLKSILSDL